MATKYDPAPTAEQIVGAVDAILMAGPQNPDAQFVSRFMNVPVPRAESSLLLAEDLGLLKAGVNGTYTVASPLCRYLATSTQIQRATVLRIILESYGPFVTFRTRLLLFGDVDDAAEKTVLIHGLPEHHTDVGAVLLSLGTFSQILFATGGGGYSLVEPPADNLLTALTHGCGELDAAEQRIKAQLGSAASIRASATDVIGPLAAALVKAVGQDAGGAIQQAGNAIEAFLTILAQRLCPVGTSANGIHQWATTIRGCSGSKMPTKLTHLAGYLGSIRNAADHGLDSDIATHWTVRNQTALEYIFVGCSFIAALVELEDGNTPVI